MNAKPPAVTFAFQPTGKEDIIYIYLAFITLDEITVIWPFLVAKEAGKWFYTRWPCAQLKTRTVTAKKKERIDVEE